VRVQTFLCAVAVSVVAVGCGSSGRPPSTTTTPNATTAAATTTTTMVAVPAGAHSATDAADDLVRAWSEGDRAAAATVAAPEAVDALFAARYPGTGLAIDRGCGDTPIVCSFGPPGGADPDDALYELTMAQSPDGLWYVISVQVDS
jgi:hypothetical protein